MTEATSTANNGVNVAALIAAREALTKAPAAAQFKFAPPANGRTALTVTPPSKVFTA